MRAPARAVRGLAWGVGTASTAAIRADARRFRQLVVSDTAERRTAALFSQGLQTRGSLELDLGDRVGAL